MNDFILSGFDELQEDLKKAIDYYPDMAEKELEKQGKKFKKQAKENTLQVTKKRTGNLTSGYRTTKALGYRGNIEVHFMAESKKNPHFHLVEHGHVLYAGGKNKHASVESGFVPGKHMIQKTALEYQEQLPKAMEAMRDKILKEAGLL